MNVDQWARVLTVIGRGLAPLAGLAVIYHETVLAAEPRPILVTTALAMMGLVEALLTHHRQLRGPGENGGSRKPPDGQAGDDDEGRSVLRRRLPLEEQARWLTV